MTQVTMITHLDPDTWNMKSSGPQEASEAGEGYGIPVELFPILKDDAV